MVVFVGMASPPRSIGAALKASVARAPLSFRQRTTKREGLCGLADFDGKDVFSPSRFAALSRNERGARAPACVKAITFDRGGEAIEGSTPRVTSH